MHTKAWSKHSKIFGILVLVTVLCLLSFAAGEWHARANGSVTLYADAYVKTASYIVYKSGSTYYAVSGLTGERLTSGVDAGAVGQAAIDALPTTGGNIFFAAGNYDFLTGLSWTDKYVVLEGVGQSPWSIDWGTVFNKKFSGTLINISYSDPTVSGFHIKGFKMNGGRASGYTGRGIEVYQARYWTIENVVMDRFEDNFIRIINCGVHKLETVHLARGYNAHMLYMTGSTDWKWYDVMACTLENGTYQYDACYIAYSSGEIHGSHFESGESNGRYGLYLGACFLFTAVETRIEYCGYTGVYILNSNYPVKLIGLTVWKVNAADQVGHGGIVLSSVANATIIGASVEDRRETPTLKYGIKETDTSDYNIILGSTFLGATTSNITIIGANTHVSSSWNGTDWIDNYP